MTAPLRAGEPTTVNVALGSRAYDIVIGRGLLGDAGRAHRGAQARRRGRDRHRRERRARAISTPPRRSLPPPACAHASHRRAARRGIEELRMRSRRVCDALLDAADRAQRRRRRARRRRGRRSRRLRRRDACGAASTSCRCRPRCWRRSIPRSAARPASIRATARTWSAPSISRSWCSPTPRCSTRLPRANSAPAMPRSPSTACSAMPASSPGWRRTGRTSSRGGPAREHAIADRCRGKAAIVARDERETGERALLNLGHTFGHALEAAAGFSDRLLHGEAVAIGMALRVRVLGPARPAARRTTPSACARHLAAVGLPTQHRATCRRVPANADALMELIAQDKKVRRGKLTFILVRGIGAGLHRARRRSRAGARRSSRRSCPR